MSAADPELDRLFAAWAEAVRNVALRRSVGIDCERARAAIDAYLAARYVRREPTLDPSARATLARMDATEADIRARMTPEEYERFCQARHEAVLIIEEGQ